MKTSSMHTFFGLSGENPTHVDSIVSSDGKHVAFLQITIDGNLLTLHSPPANTRRNALDALEDLLLKCMRDIKTEQAEPVAASAEVKP